MRDIVGQLQAWYNEDTPFALVTVIHTWASSPKAPGAAMAVSSTGEVIGSISGGCVEGAAYELAQDVLQSGVPTSHVYGIADGDAFAVGLTCGGKIEIFVELVNAHTYPEFPLLADAIAERRAVSVATVVDAVAGIGRHLVVLANSSVGSLGSAGLDQRTGVQARGLLEAGRTRSVHVGRNGEQRMDQVTVFIASFAPPPQMYVFGAIDFAGAVVRMGKFLGYRVTLCDARAVFATKRRFPDADDVVVQWPHQFLAGAVIDERTVICVLTHDPKFDLPLLTAALKTSAAYVGAMGSRRTHDDRLAQLRDAGLSPSDLQRLSSPIGLDLGARTPEETAVSIAAEIIATQCGGSGQRLRSLSASIHHAPIHHDAASMDASPREYDLSQS
ncbi:XdhC/CoxI family protein [Cryobacterium sp. Hh7]|uniref:XdhC family protein n=1 Tax=Cryobacterium sp. Hh7 TaxID=1259159 RepID=UPI0010693050|nr:XdhC/CoxI family protein [Cryobacterium sp. Hh7]TFD56968.1 XdhC/CoxI family protein [Cryobacterium sp. Hh7]